MPKPPTTHVDELGRVCSYCGKYKHWDEYYNKNNGYNGKNTFCKKCTIKKKTMSEENRQEMDPVKVQEMELAKRVMDYYRAKGRDLGMVSWKEVTGDNNQGRKRGPERGTRKRARS